MSNRKFNGERLKSARIYRGLTVAELADKIGVSKQAISQYEKGDNTPEFKKMTAITSCLDFPPEYFFQSSNFNIKTNSTYFRALLSTNKKNRAQQIIKMEHLITIYKILSNYIEFPALNLPKLKLESISIEKTAQELRSYWGLSDQPIKDIVYVLERNGIIVTTYQTSTSDIDAYSQLTTVNGEDKYIIVLSKNKNSAVRTQFDAAHELGHILLHDWTEDIESLTREEFKEREKQANDFAAAFLLPKESFIKDVSLYPRDLEYYKQLKKKWRVSIQAMIIRAHQLEVLSFNQYQYLMRQISLNDWRKKEPLDDTLETPKPTILSKSIDLLLDNNIFSGDDFIKDLAENNIALKAKEVELLLNLNENTLVSKNKEDTKIISLKPREIM